MRESMRSTTTAPMEISERELHAATRDLDELHHSARAGWHSAVDNLAEAIRGELQGLRNLERLAASRRNFLRGGLVTAGALGGGLLVAACGSDSSSSTASSGGSASGSTSGGAAADLKVAQLAASLEVLAVGAYTTALQAANQGAFGTVPPAFATFGQTAIAQHTDHMKAWNAALKTNGLPEQTTPDPKYAAIVGQAVPTLKTIADVAKLALTLETVALETYTAGASLLTDKANRAVSLSIAPVEAQHIAILNLVLGTKPTIADSFVKTDQAASVSDLG